MPRSTVTNNLPNLWGEVPKNRTIPQHNSQKWLDFKEYCCQDVVAERSIRHILSKYSTTEFEKKLWCLEQKINQNGILINMSLVHGAINIINQLQADADKLNQALTGGINLNSNSQLLEWFQQQQGWRPKSPDKKLALILISMNLPLLSVKFWN